MTDPAAPTPGGFPPPGQGQTPYPAPGQYPPPPPPPAGGFPPPAEAPGSYPPPPPYGAPPPAAGPPPKKRSALKIVLIVAGVLVVLCVAGIFAAARLIGGALDYEVGTCLSELPGTEFETVYTGELVACDSADAAARIVEVHEGGSLDDADSLCASAPGYVAAVAVTAGDSTRLLCLAEA